MNQYKENFQQYQITDKKRGFIFILPEELNDGDYNKMYEFPFTYPMEYKGRVAILFAFEEAMYDFQAEFEIDEYTPMRYHCKECGFSHNSTAKWNVHISTNKCRRRHGLKPIENKKMGNANRTYHCKACLYTPKDATSRCSMRSHTKTNKHKLHCKAEGIDPELCMTAVEEEKKDE